MPHIPRRYSSTIGLPSELQGQPQQEHAPIPIRQTEHANKPTRMNLRMEKINLSTWEPDFEKSVLRPMFGKELTIDPNTGRLVRSANQPATASIGKS
jgi:hypothetical protein